MELLKLRFGETALHACEVRLLVLHGLSHLANMKYLTLSLLDPVNCGVAFPSWSIILHAWPISQL